MTGKHVGNAPIFNVVPVMGAEFVHAPQEFGMIGRQGWATQGAALRPFCLGLREIVGQGEAAMVGLGLPAVVANADDATAWGENAPVASDHVRVDDIGTVGQSHDGFSVAVGAEVVGGAECEPLSNGGCVGAFGTAGTEKQPMHVDAGNLWHVAVGSQHLAHAFGAGWYQEFVNVDEGHPFGVMAPVGEHVAVCGHLLGLAWPRDDINRVSKPGDFGERVVCAAVVVKREPFHADGAVMAQPFVDIGAFVPNDGTDAEIWSHRVPSVETDTIAQALANAPAAKDTGR